MVATKMHMRIQNKTNTEGFTLLELLIVVAIIGILTAVIMVAVSVARDNAKDAAAQKDIIQIAKAVEAARVGSGDNYLLTITGSGYTWGGGTAGAETRLQNALLNISNDAGTFDGLSRLLYDPWDSLYRLDENEGEQVGNPCRRDTIVTENSRVRYRFEYGSEYCKNNPQSTTGFY